MHYTEGTIMTDASTRSTESAFDARTSGILAIAGSITMLVGTAVWASSGADLDKALDGDTMAEFLTDAANSGATLVANLSLWMLGVVLIAIGGLGLLRRGRQDSLASVVGRFSLTAGTGLVLGAYSMWLGIVLGLAPAHVAGESVIGTARALGYATSIGDWVATVLILGVGIGAIVTAGRGVWVPRWLWIWGMASLATGVLTILGLFLEARTSLTMVILPVGMLFLIAAGIVAIRDNR